MNPDGNLEKMARGLVLHYLQGGTVEEAVITGREAGLPEELLESFPGMMFQATSAACAVNFVEKTLAEVLDMLAKRGAPRGEAEILVKVALQFIQGMAASGGDQRPIPHSKTAWYAYDY
ncbi:MAG: hypothetical protein ACKVQT_32895 [Burkholderiales bacterium]